MLSLLQMGTRQPRKTVRCTLAFAIIGGMDGSNNQTPSLQASASSTGQLPKLVVISGPTAIGKTALSIALAQEFSGEVVNADSRYLYRDFNIGVAKPSVAERQGVPHHLIDVLPPEGDMSLARYQDLAYQAIADITSRQKLPLLVGGTPLYINAVVEGWRIPRVPPDPEFRAAREAELAAHDVEALSEQLRHVDPVSAERCGQNARRIVRALEVFAATGQPMSSQEGKGPRPYEALEIGLTRPRAELYAAIDARVHDQFAQGLVAEVQALRQRGIAGNAPAMSSIGYRQLLPYLDGEQSLAATIAQIQHDTHRYVRHQETWLRKNPNLRWFDVSAPNASWDLRQAVADFLRT